MKWSGLMRFSASVVKTYENRKNNFKKKIDAFGRFNRFKTKCRLNR